jgi:uncharacterized protein (UPF0335 family)
MSDVTIPGGKIRAFVERIENLDTELQELNEQKKEVFAEAKGEGFDVKILKEIIKLRKQDQDERDERESLLDLYMRAMEQSEPEKVKKAAWGSRAGRWHDRRINFADPPYNQKAAFAALVRLAPFIPDRRKRPWNALEVGVIDPFGNHISFSERLPEKP